MSVRKRKFVRHGKNIYVQIEDLSTCLTMPLKSTFGISNQMFIEKLYRKVCKHITSVTLDEVKNYSAFG